jgi:rod shape-determining protein MreC
VEADSLRNENVKLHAELALARMVQVPYRDTFFTIQIDSLFKGDSAWVKKTTRPQYRFIAAKAIGNTITSASNWLIINRGSDDGLRPDMGVVTGSGIVGIVRHVGQHFSTVMSVLHRDTKISVSLKKEKALGSLIWEGGDPALMTLKFVPRHFKIIKGDEVVTSGYSEIFPKGVPVGIIEEAPKTDQENQYFWEIKVRLSQDMSSVDNVYVVDNIFYTELDNLKQNMKNEQ